MTCGTCTHSRVLPNKAGRRVVYKDRTYTCMVDIPLPVLPSCVTSAYGFKWPPQRNYMTSDAGVDCPTYNAIQKEKKT